MTTLETIYRRAPDVRYRILEDEAVVIRQRAGEVLGLNALGARLLDALDGAKSVGAVLAELASGYAVERATLERDVLAFYSELAAQGLLEVGAAKAPDVAPEVAPDAAPDTSPNAAPNAAPNIAPSATPSAAPSTAPRTASNTAPGEPAR